jgi:hypothetical protein
MATAIDLGAGHELRFTCWRPDCELNPQYDGLPDVEKFGAIIDHPAPNGTSCSGGIIFDGEVQRRLMPDRPRWTVEQWDPLTLSPSVLCTACGDHGFVRDGKWVAA